VAITWSRKPSGYFPLSKVIRFPWWTPLPMLPMCEPWTTKRTLCECKSETQCGLKIKLNDPGSRMRHSKYWRKHRRLAKYFKNLNTIFYLYPINKIGFIYFWSSQLVSIVMIIDQRHQKCCQQTLAKPSISKASWSPSSWRWSHHLNTMGDFLFRLPGQLKMAHFYRSIEVVN